MPAAAGRGGEITEGEPRHQASRLVGDPQWHVTQADAGQLRRDAQKVCGTTFTAARTDKVGRAPTSARSSAISAPVFPAPTTNTRWPRYVLHPGIGRHAAALRRISLDRESDRDSVFDSCPRQRRRRQACTSLYPSRPPAPCHHGNAAYALVRARCDASEMGSVCLEVADQIRAPTDTRDVVREGKPRQAGVLLDRVQMQPPVVAAPRGADAGAGLQDRRVDSAPFQTRGGGRPAGPAPTTMAASDVANRSNGNPKLGGRAEILRTCVVTCGEYRRALLPQHRAVIPISDSREP